MKLAATQLFLWELGEAAKAKGFLEQQLIAEMSHEAIAIPADVDPAELKMLQQTQTIATEPSEQTSVQDEEASTAGEGVGDWLVEAEDAVESAVNSTVDAVESAVNTVDQEFSSNSTAIGAVAPVDDQTPATEHVAQDGMSVSTSEDDAVDQCGIQPLPSAVRLTPLNCGYIDAYFKQIQTGRYGEWESVHGDYELSWKQQVFSPTPRTLYLIDALGTTVVKAEEYVDNKNKFLVTDCNGDPAYVIQTLGQHEEDAAILLSDVDGAELARSERTQGSNEFSIVSGDSTLLGSMVPVDNATFKVMNQTTGLPEWSHGPDAQHCFLNHYEFSVALNDNFNNATLTNITSQENRWALALSAQMLALHQADLRYGGALWDIPHLVAILNVVFLTVLVFLYLTCFYGYMRMVLSNRKYTPNELLFLQSHKSGSEYTAELFARLSRSSIVFGAPAHPTTDPVVVTELGKFDESLEQGPLDRAPSFTFRQRATQAANHLKRIVLYPFTRGDAVDQTGLKQPLNIASAASDKSGRSGGDEVCPNPMCQELGSSKQRFCAVCGIDKWDSKWKKDKLQADFCTGGPLHQGIPAKSPQSSKPEYTLHLCQMRKFKMNDDQI